MPIFALATVFGASGIGNNSYFMLIQIKRQPLIGRSLLGRNVRLFEEISRG